MRQKTKMTKSISFCGADHSWKILTLLLIASMSFEKLLIFFKTYFLLLYFSSVLRKEKKKYVICIILIYFLLKFNDSFSITRVIDLPSLYIKIQAPNLLPVILYLDDSKFYCMLDSKTSILVMSNKYLIFLLIYSILNYFLLIINSLLSKEVCNCTYGYSKSRSRNFRKF